MGLLGTYSGRTLLVEDIKGCGTPERIELRTIHKCQTNLKDELRVETRGREDKQ